MWYGGHPKVTRNIKSILGTESEDEALYNILSIDFKTIRPQYIGKPLESNDDGSFNTDWGIRRGGAHYGQALNHPLASLDHVAQVERYPFPNPDNYNFVISEPQREWAKDYCLIGGTWAPFFHDSTELVGMEKLFVDMYFNPAFVQAVIEKCFDFYYELDRRTFACNKGIIDMYFIGNDFGSQRQLLLSPEMWRKYYKPYVNELINQAKRNGCVTAVHSCGSINQIIPDLIEIGVDAINPIQVNAANMQPEMLIKEYGSDIVFFGGIDVNEILQFGSEQRVREETRRIIDILGKHGRYIVAASHDYILPEVPARNVIAIFSEAIKYGWASNYSLLFVLYSKQIIYASQVQHRQPLCGGECNPVLRGRGGRDDPVPALQRVRARTVGKRNERRSRPYAGQGSRASILSRRI